MKNTPAFETVVERHGTTVLRVCRAVLGAGADADDAWSETFLAALKAWPGIDPDTNLQAWLVTVAHRKALDITRARARHPVPAGQAGDPGWPPGTTAERGTAGTSPRGIPGEGEPDLWAAVALLPERQRLAIAYHYLGGLPHARTAELIGGTPEAVRRAAADGLKTLRRTYGPDAPWEGPTP
ncbi:RNA polymerase sigma factor [Arthrobacter sp. JSM 101049]|uniref:RNA polymerase sigma factor n=1 Tax=Arthrobacter sp. JSM 101049 TaxID=929097 RepID=UPI00356B0408